MRSIGIFLLLLGSSTFLFSQYSDYIGAGHDTGITVTTSSGTAGATTLSGDGLVARQMEAARFLSHASFGGNLQDINEVMNVGYDSWFTTQEQLPVTNYLTKVEDLWDFIFDEYVNAGFDPDDIFGPYHPHFSYAWFENLMKGDDQLRQKMSYALSQILVISINSDLRDWAYALASYYDVLQTHSLGNFKDLLTDVSYHPAMGYYLSHFNNPKTDAANNIHPDENYAREIMQLFSIGLYELNLDGTHKLDAQGNSIPTYDNDDIKELAKVFTGLGAGGLQPWVEWTTVPYFGLGIYATDRTVPMIMYDSEHEQGSKTMFDGDLIIPSGQTGDEDIADLIDYLFNHPNVGPFISKRLIQTLIKSNPTPAYVERVATVFNNNGSGVRGDLFAVTKAIMLDQEANSCDAIESNNPGRLREPMMRLAAVLKAFPTDTNMDRYWDAGRQWHNHMEQQVLASPTVFNFYSPTYQPNGAISENNLVAPEFQIFNTKTSIGWINRAHAWSIWDFMLYDWEDDDIFGDNSVHLNDAHLESFINNNGIENFLNHMDIVLGYGQTSENIRALVRESAEDLNWSTIDDAQIMLYLFLISPDFAILK